MRKKIGHAHYSRSVWLWINQQVAHEISAAVYSSGACVPTCDGGYDDQCSIWGISLNILSDIQLLLDIFGQCGQMHGFQFVG